MVSTIQELENNQNFIRDSYENQLEARAYIFDLQMSKDQDYMSLNDQDKKEIRDSYIYSPPKFTGEKFGGSLGLEQSFLESLVDFHNKKRRGDQSANLGTGLEAYAMSVLKNFSLPSLWQQFNPETKKNYESVEAQKYFKYLDYLSNTYDELRTANTAGALSGFLSEMLLLGGVTGAVSKSIKGAVEGSKAIAKLSPFAEKLIKFSAPISADAAISGSYGVLRDNLLSIESGKGSIFDEGIGNIAKTFGGYVAIDFAIGSGLGAAVPFFSGLFKKTFGKQSVDPLAKNLSKEELDSLYKEYSKTPNANIMKEQLGEYHNATIQFKDNVRPIIKDQKLLENIKINPTNYPSEKSLLAGNAVGLVIEDTPDAGFRAWKQIDNGNGRFSIVNKKFKTRNELDSYIASVVKEKRSMLVDELAKNKTNYYNIDEFDSLTSYYKSYSNVADNLDSVFDVTKTPGLTTDEINSIKSVRPKGYIPTSDRNYISKIEADDIISRSKNENNLITLVNIPKSESILKNIKSGLKPFSDEPFPIQRIDADPNALFVSSKPFITKNIPIEQISDPSIYYKLISDGYDSMVFEDAVIPLFPNKQIKVLAESVDDIGRPKAQFNPSLSKAQVKADITPELLTSNLSTTVGVMQKFKGDIDKTDFENFINIYLKGKGISENPISVSIGPVEKAIITENGITIPSSIKTIDQHKDLVSKTIDLLESVTFKTIGKRDFSKSAISSYYNNSIKKFINPMSDEISKTEFVNHILSKGLGTSIKVLPIEGTGKFIISSGKKTIEATNTEDLIYKTMLASMDEPSLKLAFAENGIGIIKQQDGSYSLVSQGKTIFNAPDFLTVVSMSPDVKIKLPSKFAPDSITIGQDSIGVTFKSGKLISNRKSALNFLNQFENYSQKILSKTFNIKNVEVSMEGSGYTIHLPQFSTYKTFQTVEDATEYINNYKKFDKLQEIGAKKGLNIYNEGGKIVVQKGSERILASTPDELSSIFKKYPDVDPQSPEIFKQEIPEIDNYVEAAIAQQKYKPGRFSHDPVNIVLTPSNITGNKELNVKLIDMIKSKTSLMTAYVDGIGRRLDIPGYQTTFRGTEAAVRLYSRDYTIGHKLAMETISTGGKTPAPDIRKKLYYMLGAENADELSNIEKSFGKITKEETQKVADIKKYFDNMFLKSGLPLWTYLKTYAPRLRKFVNDPQNINLINNSTDGFDIIEKALPGVSHNQEVKTFFSNLRTTEIVDAVAKDDILDVMLLYNRLTAKKLHIDPAIKDMLSFMQKNESKIPEEVVMRTMRYIDDVIGAPSRIDDDSLIKLFGRVVNNAKSISGKVDNVSTDKEAGETFFRNFLSLSYVSTMGFRPWLPIKNALSSYTLTAAKLGFNATNKAINNLSKFGDDYYSNLMRNGIITTHPPIVNELSSVATMFGKLTEKSLKWFKNSDDYTRALVYHASEVKLDEAIELYGKRKFASMDNFKEMSGISLLPKEIGNNAYSLILEYIKDPIVNSGKLKAAKDIIGFNNMEEIIGAYRVSQSPELFKKGVIGKLFGQYGTYSAVYRDALVKGLRNGSNAQKIGYISRYIGTTTAMFIGLTELGIKAKDFIPGTGAIFTGGPYFDYSITALQSLRGDRKGEQARAELKFKTLGLVPGTMQYNFFTKAATYYDQGDYWRSFLALSSTPTIVAND